MKVIIAGASGYIGKQLYLQAAPIFETYGTFSSISKRDDGFLPLRLNDLSNFNFDFFQKSDIVFLTAAISSPDVCLNERDRAWAVNVTGTIDFISRVISRGSRVIFFSSDTVYGESVEKCDESTDCNPKGEYAEMKREVEKRFLGNPLFKTIRLSYVFSREDKFTKYLSVCANRGEAAEIFHPFYRAVIHRDDVVQGVIALSQLWDTYPQPVINFGGPEVLARTTFAETLKKVALPNLQFNIIEPEPDFFKKRPKIIRLVSPILSLLLGRPAHSLSEAASMEFN